MKQQFPPFIYLLIVLVSACNEDKPCPACPVTEPIEERFFFDIKKSRKECLNWDSLTIDRELPIWRASKEEVLKKFGKPDKIETIDKNLSRVYQDETEPVYRFHYGKTIWEGVEDRMRLEILDFASTDVQLIDPRVILSKNTHIGNVCDAFPEDCKLIIPKGNATSANLFLRNCNSREIQFLLIVIGETVTRFVVL